MKQQKNLDVSWWDRIVTLPQYLIPHHLFSMLMYRLTRCQIVWFKNLFIRFIVKQYKVNIAEAAEQELASYASFNAFFTRELRDGARPIALGMNTVVSPVDGVISQIGDIESGQIIQAKGYNYSIESLLGDDVLAASFNQGQFTTIYLSPKDYHRIHMPLTGTLREMTYIPGKLFSVSPRTVKTVPDLFARNERVVTVFDTEYGQMVVVLVGAIFVGSMETVWAGQVTPPYGKLVQHWQYRDEQAITLNKGEELGRFNMGSTVILLMPSQSPDFLTSLQADHAVQMGQAIS